MSINNICLDVWGGENSQEHVARYMLMVDEALVLAKTELQNGFLVNLRQAITWGQEQNFDLRIPL